MKHIIKYRGLLQESESTLSSSVYDLRHLLDLGMIASDEYSKKAIEILRSTGRLSTVIEPEVSIDEEDAEDDLWSDWAQGWSASTGERMVKAEGSVDSMGAGEITFLLDTGLVITIEMSYGGFWTYGVDVKVRIEDREVASDTDVTEPGATWSGTEEMLGQILSDTSAKYGHLAIDRLIDSMINN